MTSIPIPTMPTDKPVSGIRVHMFIWTDGAFTGAQCPFCRAFVRVTDEKGCEHFGGQSKEDLIFEG